MHGTFSLAFSSRFAEIQTSNFRRKVVRQHIEGVVGSIIWFLLENLVLFPVVKEFWNCVKYWQSYAMSLVYYFFGTQCRPTHADLIGVGRVTYRACNAPPACIHVLK